MEDAAPRSPPPPSSPQILEIAATIAGTVGWCGEKHGGSALRGRLSITRDSGVEFGGEDGGAADRRGEKMRGGREGSYSCWMYEQVIP